MPGSRYRHCGRRRAASGRADWIKEGAVVIDVGINRDEKRKLCDVDFDDVKNVAQAHRYPAESGR
ncbi:MAG: hypothetical protein ACLTCB_08515 [Merdibacter sp.]